MEFVGLVERLERVRSRVADVQVREGLDHGVRIIAVTKGHPPEAVKAACEAGLDQVGENRVQEAVRKQELLAGLAVEWHLIGHLQTNKARYVPGRFVLVHSVDSARLGTALARVQEASERGTRLGVLIQVNVSGEDQRSGCSPDQLDDLVGVLGELHALDVRGLMTMAPFTDDEHVQRSVFAQLRVLRDRVRSAGQPLPELSMGMSGDYLAAVAEGATLLRLGTVLLGERPQ